MKERFLKKIIDRYAVVGVIGSGINARVVRRAGRRFAVPARCVFVFRFFMALFRRKFV